MLLPGPDSLAATSLAHLREVAAFRIVRDVQVTKYRAERIERALAATALHEALAKTDTIAANNLLKFEACEVERKQAMTQWGKAEKRADRYKTWGWISTAVAVVATGIILVK